MAAPRSTPRGLTIRAGVGFAGVGFAGVGFAGVGLAAGLLTACAASEPAVLPAPPRAARDCAAYSDAPDVYAYCIRRVAAASPEAGAARGICATLTTAGDAECRRAWVEARVQEGRGALAPDMLAMCEGQPDCALLVMDNFPLPDVLDQISQCEVLAGPYVDHCASHALDSWANARPSEVDVLRVAGATTKYHRAYAESIRVLRYCQGRRLADAPAGHEAEWVGCGGADAVSCVRLYSELEQLGGRRMGPTGPQTLCVPLAPPGPPPPARAAP